MKRLSSLNAVGESAMVHLLEVELDDAVLGGIRPDDPFDSDRIREAGNLLKRVCSKQCPSGDYAVVSARDGTIRIRCGFRHVSERDLVADLARADSGPQAAWASLRRFVLDAEKLATLTASGIPRDNRGAGRRAREKNRSFEEQQGLRWFVRGVS